jgi:hypothetical protein
MSWFTLQIFQYKEFLFFDNYVKNKFRLLYLVLNVVKFSNFLSGTKSSAKFSSNFYFI